MSGALDQDLVGLFPGQGSISAHAGVPWRQCKSWHVVDRISASCGVDVAALLLETSNDDIVRTDRAQLATFALSLVGWHDYVAQRPAPKFLAGHSLGEFSALVAAGILSLEDGARLVGARGSAMANASAQHPGTMVALMGGDEKARARLDELNDIWLANVNGTGQIVVSGTQEAIDGLLANSRELGWRRATALPVGGAFHSPLMAPAQKRLDEVLASVQFHEGGHLVASNVDGQWRSGGEEWRSLLSRQLTSPVQFVTMIEGLDSNVRRGVEMPPSGVLVGLTKRIREFESLDTISEPVQN
jgi:[acyl-carrier-protein] S-malonyltransferase